MPPDRDQKIVELTQELCASKIVESDLMTTIASLERERDSAKLDNVRLDEVAASLSAELTQRSREVREQQLERQDFVDRENRARSLLAGREKMISTLEDQLRQATQERDQLESALAESRRQVIWKDEERRQAIEEAVQPLTAQLHHARRAQEGEREQFEQRMLNVQAQCAAQVCEARWEADQTNKSMMNQTRVNASGFQAPSHMAPGTHRPLPGHRPNLPFTTQVFNVDVPPIRIPESVYEKGGEAAALKFERDELQGRVGALMASLHDMEKSLAHIVLKVNEVEGTKATSKAPVALLAQKLVSTKISESMLKRKLGDAARMEMELRSKLTSKSSKLQEIRAESTQLKSLIQSTTDIDTRGSSFAKFFEGSDIGSEITDVTRLEGTVIELEAECNHLRKLLNEKDILVSGGDDVIDLKTILKEMEKTGVLETELAAELKRAQQETDRLRSSMHNLNEAKEEDGEEASRNLNALGQAVQYLTEQVRQRDERVNELEDHLLRLRAEAVTMAPLAAASPKGGESPVKIISELQSRLQDVQETKLMMEQENHTLRTQLDKSVADVTAPKTPVQAAQHSQTIALRRQLEETQAHLRSLQDERDMTSHAMKESLEQSLFGTHDLNMTAHSRFGADDKVNAKVRGLEDRIAALTEAQRDLHERYTTRGLEMERAELAKQHAESALHVVRLENEGLTVTKNELTARIGKLEAELTTWQNQEDKDAQIAKLTELLHAEQDINVQLTNQLRGAKSEGGLIVADADHPNDRSLATIVQEAGPGAELSEAQRYQRRVAELMQDIDEHERQHAQDLEAIKVEMESREKEYLGKFEAVITESKTLRQMLSDRQTRLEELCEMTTREDHNRVVDITDPRFALVFERLQGTRDNEARLLSEIDVCSTQLQELELEFRFFQESHTQSVAMYEQHIKGLEERLTDEINTRISQQQQQSSKKRGGPVKKKVSHQSSTGRGKENKVRRDDPDAYYAIELSRRDATITSLREDLQRLRDQERRRAKKERKEVGGKGTVVTKRDDAVLRAKVMRLETDLKNTQLQLDAARTERNNAEKELNTIRVVADGIGSRLADYENKVAELEKANEELVSAEAERVANEGKPKEESEIIQELRASLSRARESLKDAKDDANNKKDLITGLRRELEHEREVLDEVKASKVTLASKLQQLRTDLSRKDQYLNEVKVRLQAVTDAEKADENATDALKNKIRQDKSQLQRRDAMIRELREQVVSLQTKIKQGEDVADAVQQHVSVAKKHKLESDRRGNQLQALRAKVTDQTTEITTLREQVRKLTEQLGKAKSKAAKHTESHPRGLAPSQNTGETEGLRNTIRGLATSMLSELEGLQVSVGLIASHPIDESGADFDARVTSQGESTWAELGRTILDMSPREYNDLIEGHVGGHGGAGVHGGRSKQSEFWKSLEHAIASGEYSEIGRLLDGVLDEITRLSRAASSLATTTAQTHGTQGPRTSFGSDPTQPPPNRLSVTVSAPADHNSSIDSYSRTLEYLQAQLEGNP